MEDQRVFYSDNDTGTFADPLKAVGLAEVLRGWLGALRHDAEPIHIEDKGAYYRIELPLSLDDPAVEQVRDRFPAGQAKPLASKKQEDKAAAGGRALEGFRYDDMRAQADAYFAQLKKLSSADRKRFNEHPEEFPELQGLRPPPDLPLYVYVNHFKVADGYNTLLEQWRGGSIEAFRANLRLVLSIFGQHPNAVAQGVEQWEAWAKAGLVTGRSSPTLLQLVNPASGKGGNAPKANGLGIGNLDGFWLIEYLKFVGLFTITAPFVVANSKDRKTYVLRPVKVDLGGLRTVMDDFREHLFGTTAIKLDVLAALRFTGALVRYLHDAHVARQGRDPLLALAGEAPRVTDIATGFEVAFYKDMGSAYATMNLATINLPGWLGPISSPEVGDAVLALLDEHERVISGIQSAKGEEGSDEIELLRRYRDFVSGRDVERFFDFAARYGDYCLARRHRNQWAGQFTTTRMEALMAQGQKKQPFSKIIEDEGFQAIAAAIRQATVIGQYWAARQTGYPYEVRYGLGQELLRAANYPEHFLAALSEFIQSYNAENARIDERIAKKSLPDVPGMRRASVRAEHINHVVRLIDEYGNSELICKMLVAYGYARDPRLQADPSTGEPGQP
jgi:hypothetical protein